MTTETGDGNITKEAKDDEIIEQTNPDDGIIEQTKTSGTEKSATGHGFVAAEGVVIREREASENKDRPRVLPC
jgi:hypothetical protein